MASRGPAGTHLSAPNRKASISFAAPKPNEVVSRQGGQLTKANNTLIWFELERTYYKWQSGFHHKKHVASWSIGGVGITLDHRKGINVLLLSNEYFCP